MSENPQRPQRPLLYGDRVAPPDARFADIPYDTYVGVANPHPTRPTLLVLPELLKASQ